MSDGDSRTQRSKRATIETSPFLYWDVQAKLRVSEVLGRLFLMAELLIELQPENLTEVKPEIPALRLGGEKCTKYDEVITVALGQFSFCPAFHSMFQNLPLPCA